MIGYIYVQATKWNTKGWTHVLVMEDEQYMKESLDNQEDAFLLHIVNIPEVKTSALASIGFAKVDEMKKDLCMANAKAEQDIKEYESKFMLLECVTGE